MEALAREEWLVSRSTAELCYIADQVEAKRKRNATKEDLRLAISRKLIRPEQTPPAAPAATQIALFE
ncbi:MAG: hypothetical protein HC914_16240 [Chloroflexaceae bacterium]|nr:hypothetical protein [Chloroflexaceae bacterium]